MVTIRNIADRCGMSIAAVSRALNYQPGISPERAEQIRQTAQEMGYSPNAAARMLKTNRSNTIGVLYQNKMAHEFFSVVLQGIHDAAGRYGYELIFLNGATDAELVDHARQRQCAGVLLVQGDATTNSAAEQLSCTVPTVTIEHQYPGSATISTDNIAAMEEMVRYVRGKGHERIAFIHGEPVGQMTRDRLSGFYRGCRDAGVQVEAGYVIESCYRNPDAAAAATRALLSLPVPPTCILYPDDTSYLGGLAELERQGLSVPRDMSCVGFDGVMLSRMLTPKLTTYFQDAEGMGRRATRELIAAIEDPRCAVSKTIFVPGYIQEGGTVRDLTEEGKK